MANRHSSRGCVICMARSRRSFFFGALFLERGKLLLVRTVQLSKQSGNRSAHYIVMLYFYYLFLFCAVAETPVASLRSLVGLKKSPGDTAARGAEFFTKLCRAPTIINDTLKSRRRAALGPSVAVFSRAHSNANRRTDNKTGHRSNGLFRDK